MRHRERVNIYVDDVNEFSPVWNEQKYTASVDEGTQHKDVIQVAASDADGSPAMSKICQYHVVTPGVPFEVDELGKYLFEFYYFSLLWAFCTACCIHVLQQIPFVTNSSR